MASGLITSWQIEGEKAEAVTDFFSWTPKITADGNCSHEIIRRWLLGRKAMTNLDSVFKSRDHKGPYSQSYGFSSTHYRCESWTTDKAEHQRTDPFKLWGWRRLLRVPWNERRSNQSILKEIIPEYSLGGLTRKLKLQYFGHVMWRADLLEETLMLGKTEGKRKSRWQRMRWLDSIASSTDMSLSKLRETVENKGARHATVHGF